LKSTEGKVTPQWGGEKKLGDSFMRKELWKSYFARNVGRGGGVSATRILALSPPTQRGELEGNFRRRKEGKKKCCALPRVPEKDRGLTLPEHFREEENAKLRWLYQICRGEGKKNERGKAGH